MLQGYKMQPGARTAGGTDIGYPVFGFNGSAAAALTVSLLMMIDGAQRTDQAAILGRRADLRGVR